jgi:hypothetical protein
MKSLFLLLLVLLVSGCTTVKYNGAETRQTEVDYPAIDSISTAYVGDNLVAKGTISEEKILLVRNAIDGVYYDIPSLSYPQIGYDNKNDFYSGHGVIPAALSDPVQALAVRKGKENEVCVITIFGGSACYEGDIERKTKASEKGNNFQQTLIYSGRIENKINIGYREFSNNLARPAFNNDVEYDLNASKIIGYKGSLIEAINADNTSITYKLIRNFK